ncbi:hypothetical protein ACFLZW_04535 [Chloroflexota bacterium]
MTDESHEISGRISGSGLSKATNTTAAAIAGFISGLIIGLGVCVLVWYLKYMIYDRLRIDLYFNTEFGLLFAFTFLSVPVTGFASGLWGAYKGVRNYRGTEVKAKFKKRIGLSLYSGARGGLVPGLVFGLVSGILFGGGGTY